MGHRILLIDDVPENLYMLRRILREAYDGVEVLEASNGIEGLQHAYEDAPDIILLDVSMPDVDGFEVCRRLKADPITEIIPVMMISGVLTDTEHRTMGLESGADGYLCKPYAVEELLAQVKTLLRIRRTEDELRRHRRELERTVDEQREEIDRNQVRYRKLFDQLYDAIFITDGNGQLVEANQAAEKKLGYTAEDILKLRRDELFAEGNKEWLAELEKRIAEDGSGRVDGQLCTRSGELFDAEIACTKIETESGSVLQWVVRDISERRQLEQRQTRMRDGLHAIVMAAMELIACPDLDSVYRRSVELAREQLGMERCGLFISDGSIVRGTYGTDFHGQTCDEHGIVSQKDEHWEERHRDRMAKGISWIRIERDYSEWHEGHTETSGRGWVVITTVPSLDGDTLGLMTNDAAISRSSLDPVWQDVFGIYCSLVGSIIERKQVEERLRHALNDKDALLREVHHRVKNNLQIISSLLNLQAARLESGSVRNALLETYNRVQSMAHVHEQLYQTESAARVDMERYVRDLATTLLTSVSIPKIELVDDIEPLQLDVSIAIPCGLLVNELVTNVIKHAFQDVSLDNLSPRVVVRLEKSDEAHVRLVVKDNGKGMMRDPSPDTDTLGLRLVHLLVQQLEGTLEVIGDGGTTVTVVFPCAG